MRVYLIAAPEDEAEGEKLAAYLSRFGVHIRTEYGKFAYPPAQHGEFTLALWSRNAMMSSRQMMLTNRAIDAWAEGQLVMARLEHGLNPRGLSDLDMIDLTFEAAREHRYAEVLKALRALEDAQRPAGTVIPQPEDLSAPSVGDGKGASEHLPTAAPVGDLSEEVSERLPGKRPDLGPDGDQALNGASPEQPADYELSQTRRERAVERMAEYEPAAKSSGSGGLLGFLVLIIAGAGLGVAVWQEALTWQIAAMIGGGLLVAVMFINIIISAMSAPKPRARKAARAKRSAASAAAKPARVAAPAAAEKIDAETHAVFVSYSHQNAETVLPLVETVEAQGLSIWIDKEEMRAGQTWAGQIVRAIKSAEQFCLMCSEQSFASDHVRREVYLADKYGKAMVPVRLDAAEMPEDIEYFLAGRQWVDLTSLSEDDRAAIVHGALSVAKN